MTISMCAVGDNVLDRYPQEGLAFPGGSATNAAVFASRLGVAASYIGIVGSDSAASFIIDSLQAEGVDASRVRRQDAPNPTTDVVVEEDGNRRFIAHTVPEIELRLDGGDLDFLRTVDWIHTGHSSLVEHEIERLAACAPVSFDFSKRDLDYAAPLLPFIALATFSRDDLSTDECIVLLRSAVELGAGLAVVTRGAAGSVAMTQGRIVKRAASPATVVDTIGAGDAFQASLMTELTRGASLDAALSAASDFAAETCARRGAFGHERPLSAFTDVGQVETVDR